MVSIHHLNSINFMTDNNLDSLLVKRCYNILASKYVTEKGKKFIFHLISAFLPKDAKSKCLTDEDTKMKALCCLGGCELVSSTTQIDLSPRKVIVDHKLKLYPRIYHYGYKSDTSDKYISEEGLEALIQFVEYKVGVGDKFISRMYNHIKPQVNKRNNAKSEDIQAIPARNPGNKE